LKQVARIQLGSTQILVNLSSKQVEISYMDSASPFNNSLNNIALEQVGQVEGAT
jgi:hypothetical protein